MSIYIVTYDLRHNSNSEDYNNLISLIKEEGVWACLGDSSYLIESDSSVVDLRNKYKQVLGCNALLFIGKVTAPAAWTGYSEDVTNWIKKSYNIYE